MAEKEIFTGVSIRASGLPSVFDCERQWAAGMAVDPKTNFGPIAEMHGFKFAKKPKGIGATVGLACHDGIGKLMQARLDGLTLDPVAVAVTNFRQEDKDGDIEYEENKGGVTKNADVAVEQIKRMVEAYMPVLATFEPAKVEFNLAVTLAPGYRLTGHPDIYTKEGDIRDMKFGKSMSAYEPQLGAYHLMARTVGMPVNRLFVDHVKRSTINKDQPPAQITEYNVATAEQSAYRLANMAVEKIEKFKETGDPWAFKPNPSTKLCSKKWCRAWGTPFCDLGRPGKDDEAE